MLLWDLGPEEVINRLVLVKVEGVIEISPFRQLSTIILFIGVIVPGNVVKWYVVGDLVVEPFNFNPELLNPLFIVDVIGFYFGKVILEEGKKLVLFL